MSWLHRLQQRLSITKNEALTLLTLSLFLLLGTAGRYTCRQMRPVSADFYAEIDSLFAARSSTASDSPEPLAGRPVGPSATPADEATGEAIGSQAIDSTTVHPAIGNAAAGPNLHVARVDSASAQADGAADVAAQGALVDVNRASARELQQLPRIGPVIAQRIVDFRETYGSFRSIDELVSVKGIGVKTLDHIRAHVRLTSTAESKAVESDHPVSVPPDSAR